MVDVLSKTQRSKNMRAIKSRSKLEDKVSKALWKRGIRFRRNVKSLYGNPDIAIKKYRIVIFIDSCFWHSCPLHGNTPKSNRDFWYGKLQKNKERDEEVNRHYKEGNWYIKRVWEHEIKEDLENVAERLSTFIKKVKSQEK